MKFLYDVEEVPTLTVYSILRAGYITERAQTEALELVLGARWLLWSRRVGVAGGAGNLELHSDAAITPTP